MARASGDSDLTVSGGASLTFTSANWNTPQTVTLAAAEDVDLANGSAVFDVTSSWSDDRQCDRHRSRQRYAVAGRVLHECLGDRRPDEYVHREDWPTSRPRT